jgi:hypothetical protein
MDINIEIKPIEKKRVRPPRNEYMKDYMKNAPNIICSCGGIFKSYSKHIHNNSKKHINYLIKNPIPVYKQIHITVTET